MSQALPLPGDVDVPQLRLVTEAELPKTGGVLSPSMRLSEFFELVYLPWLRGKLATPETITLYRESIAHWVRITGDPPLFEICDETCYAFIEGLAASPGRKAEFMASQTIFRHCNQVQWVLNRTGPREANHPKRRRNKALLDEVPMIDKPAVDVDPPDGDFTFEETLQIMSAFISHPPRAPKARLMGGVPSGAWWRALITLLYYSGLRIGAAMRLEWNMIDGDWLTIPARIMKRRKGKKQFLQREARDAIELLRRGQSLIFAYPSWIEKKGARRSMRRVFERMLGVAGLPPHRRFGFHGFRKAHASELAMLNPLAAQLSLGHESSKTTNERYVNHRVAAEGIKRMPSLKAAERQRTHSTQMQLFQ